MNFKNRFVLFYLHPLLPFPSSARGNICNVFDVSPFVCMCFYKILLAICMYTYLCMYFWFIKMVRGYRFHLVSYLFQVALLFKISLCRCVYGKSIASSGLTELPPARSTGRPLTPYDTMLWWMSSLASLFGSLWEFLWDS